MNLFAGQPVQAVLQKVPDPTAGKRRPAFFHGLGENLISLRRSKTQGINGELREISLIPFHDQHSTFTAPESGFHQEQDLERLLKQARFH